MDEDKNVNITYETLFDLLRREKDREELQKLDSAFFQSVVSYLEDKNRILENREGQSELFHSEEKAKTIKELNNIKRILKELYERREKKVINMAVDKSKSKPTIIDYSCLLREERAIFDMLVGILDKGREGILANILNLKMPLLDEAEEKKEEKPVKAENKKETQLVRFLHAVPKFVGRELEEYGPFEEEDVASLPSDIAQILINKRRAEEIEEEEKTTA
ncbi:hypothetical protein J4209_00460 [Candidatus Woesearchaeota archaeon]|nr:hypothetical protein [Candidatus Woesearchaeota archaeon]